MYGLKKKNNTQHRSRRSDGDVTRAHIFEVAGYLFAEKGYANTTSKEICERAKTNIAAINYHFGSRDQLYLSLLEKAHDYYVDKQFFTKLDQESISSKEKLEKMLDAMIQKAMTDEGWKTRILVRELLDPTPVMGKQIYTTAMKKMSVLLRILGDITNIPVTDNRLLQCALHVMAPCAILLLTKREVKTPFSPLFSYPQEGLSTQVKRFIFAGLEAEKLAAKK